LGIFAKKYCFIDNFFFKYHQDGLFLVTHITLSFLEIIPNVKFSLHHLTLGIHSNFNWVKANIAI